MVSDIHRTILSVSDTRTVPATGHMLIPVQARTRSASLTTDGSNISYLHLAYLASYLPRHQELASVVAS